MAANTLDSKYSRLKIKASTTDKIGSKLLYQYLVEKAKEEGISGATVFRGFEGFGAHSRIHTSRILRLSKDLPIVIEIVDAEENIQGFLPVLDDMVQEGLVTVEKATVIFYRAGDPPAEP